MSCWPGPTPCGNGVHSDKAEHPVLPVLASPQTPAGRSPSGGPVERFLLTPNKAGPLIERFGDEMIEALFRAGSTNRLGSLLWVWGTLRALPGEPGGEVPVYVLENAWTEPANLADIANYYR